LNKCEKHEREHAAENKRDTELAESLSEEKAQALQKLEHCRSDGAEKAKGLNELRRKRIDLERRTKDAEAEARRKEDRLSRSEAERKVAEESLSTAKDDSSELKRQAGEYKRQVAELEKKLAAAISKTGPSTPPAAQPDTTGSSACNPPDDLVASASTPKISSSGGNEVRQQDNAGNAASTECETLRKENERPEEALAAATGRDHVTDKPGAESSGSDETPPTRSSTAPAGEIKHSAQGPTSTEVEQPSIAISNVAPARIGEFQGSGAHDDVKQPSTQVPGQQTEPDSTGGKEAAVSPYRATPGQTGQTQDVPGRVGASDESNLKQQLEKLQQRLDEVEGKLSDYQKTSSGDGPVRRRMVLRQEMSMILMWMLLALTIHVRPLLARTLLLGPDRQMRQERVGPESRKQLNLLSPDTWPILPAKVDPHQVGMQKPQHSRKRKMKATHPRQTPTRNSSKRSKRYRRSCKILKPSLPLGIHSGDLLRSQACQVVP